MHDLYTGLLVCALILCAIMISELIWLYQN